MPSRSQLPIAALREEQRRWSGTEIKQRLGLVRNFRRLLVENAARLAEASTLARGRVLTESLVAEVFPLITACRFLEAKALRLLKPRHLRLSWLFRASAAIYREPFGVILIIGPGNYPLLLAGIQTLQAVVAGNTVLLKPGLGGAAVLEIFVELIHRAGFPPGLVRLLDESTESAQAALAAGPDKVVFTGSAETGAKILSQLAPQLVPAILELSGSDPVIVRADADVELVTKAIKFGLTFNAGATCLAPKRLFVQQKIATELEGRLASAVNESCVVSNARIRELVEGALSAGAHLVTGRICPNGELAGPIIIAGVPSDSALLQADVFAPVLAVVTFADDDEAVRLANDSAYALGASIFTRDISSAEQIVRQLNARSVTINDLIVPTADPQLPFGGARRSGFGVTRGAEGLLELTRPKAVTRTRGKARRGFEPIQPGHSRIFELYLKCAHTPNFKERIKALVSLVQIWKAA